MMYKNKISVIIIFAIISIQTAISQNNTNSPYTRFGYGQLSDNTSGEQRAMGGVAIGARSSHRINAVNPASYSASDSLTFMFDFGVSSLLSNFTDDAGNRNTRFTGNLDYITMQFRLFPGIGFSAGILPYSFAGYDFFTTDSVAMLGSDEDTQIRYTESYNGTGGINQFYTGFSVDVFNFFPLKSSLSFGANMYYMFGNYSNSATVLFASNPHRSMMRTNTISVNNFRFRFGAQYQNVFNNRHDLTIGAIYEPKTVMNAQATTTRTTHTVQIDTLTSSNFDLPQTFGLGVYYRLDNKWAFGMDYSLQQWSNVAFPYQLMSNYLLIDSWKLATGFEYQRNHRGRRFGDRVMYRFGANISQPYFKIDNKTPENNFGITFGVGLPLMHSRTMLNMALEYGTIGASPRLKEDYFKFTFNVSLSETWFLKLRL